MILRVPPTARRRTGRHIGIYIARTRFGRRAPTAPPENFRIMMSFHLRSGALALRVVAIGTFVFGWRNGEWVDPVPVAAGSRLVLRCADADPVDVGACVRAGSRRKNQ